MVLFVHLVRNICPTHQSLNLDWIMLVRNIAYDSPHTRQDLIELVTKTSSRVNFDHILLSTFLLLKGQFLYWEPEEFPVLLCDGKTLHTSRNGFGEKRLMLCGWSKKEEFWSVWSVVICVCCLFTSLHQKYFIASFSLPILATRLIWLVSESIIYSVNFTSTSMHQSKPWNFVCFSCLRLFSFVLIRE